MCAHSNLLEIIVCSFLNLAVINKKIKKIATENSVTSIIKTNPSKEPQKPQIENKQIFKRK